jgi:hypothetical protein
MRSVCRFGDTGATLCIVCPQRVWFCIVVESNNAKSGTMHVDARRAKQCERC